VEVGPDHPPRRARLLREIMKGCGGARGYAPGDGSDPEAILARVSRRQTCAPELRREATAIYFEAGEMWVDTPVLMNTDPHSLTTFPHLGLVLNEFVSISV
jgi:hypothetical protein